MRTKDDTFYFESELDKDEFISAYIKWIETPSTCNCTRHAFKSDTPDHMMCARQLAWKKYVTARNKSVSVN